jgi:hypothetical protein
MLAPEPEGEQGRHDGADDADPRRHRRVADGDGHVQEQPDEVTQETITRRNIVVVVAGFIRKPSLPKPH